MGAEPDPSDLRRRKIMSNNRYLPISLGIILFATIAVEANDVASVAPQTKPVPSKKEYQANLVARDKALRSQRATLRALETEAAAHKTTILKSNPECAKLVAEISALEAELAEKQAKLDSLIESNPELRRLNKEIGEAEAAVKLNHAALQEVIRERKRLEWGAK